MGLIEQRGIKVPFGHDRHQRERKVFGVMPFTVKVTSQDTGGGLLVIEQANNNRGGPPRHLHHDQDEWFYAIEGEYLVEIDGETHHLGPGDSVFAPRKTRHSWALVGATGGRLLIAFQPAGAMEGFFEEASKLQGMPPHQEIAQLFAAHGMEIVGPPLQIP
ncbi:MAG TPA: cupin domain-containing protein [Trueperaceae bacterium]